LTSTVKKIDGCVHVCPTWDATLFALDVFLAAHIRNVVSGAWVLERKKKRWW